MFYNILDDKRKVLLPALSRLKDRFYLAGGTGLALQLGHRDSLDFDFFSPTDFDVSKLTEELRTILAGHQFIITQEEKNTLSLIVDGEVKLSFFAYPYPLLEPLLKEEHLNLASIVDIACMKFAAIVGRATMKDYVDLYYILNNLNLGQLLDWSQKKMPQLDKQLILKSLVYFDDVVPEALRFKDKQEVTWPLMRQTITDKVKIQSKLN